MFAGGGGFDTLSFAALEDGALVDAVEGSVIVGGGTADRFFEFEEIIGGAGDDIIVAGGVLQVMSGGGGDDTFAFGAPAAERAKDIPDRVYEILDLEVGDRILVKEFEIRTSDGDPSLHGADGDGQGDRFEDTYSGGDPRPFRFRSETRDDGEHTWVDVMEETQSDQPDSAGVAYTIDVHGNHDLYFVTRLDGAGVG